MEGPGGCRYFVFPLGDIQAVYRELGGLDIDIARAVL